MHAFSMPFLTQERKREGKTDVLVLCCGKGSFYVLEDSPVEIRWRFLVAEVTIRQMALLMLLKFL